MPVKPSPPSQSPGDATPKYPVSFDMVKDLLKSRTKAKFKCRPSSSASEVGLCALKENPKVMSRNSGWG